MRDLCRLHNFCIDSNVSVASNATAVDSYYGLSEGGFAHNIASTRPQQLMDGGHHFDDIPRPDSIKIKKK